MKVPAVTYPRSLAGVTSDDHVIYMVGGTPLKQIAEGSPTNIIEMYDSRCGNWSRIKLPSAHEIPNNDYSNKVYFKDKTLYMISGDGLLAGVDTRNNQWVLSPKRITNSLLSSISSMTSVDKNLWIIYENSSSGISVLNNVGTNLQSLLNPNVFVKPIPSLSLI